MLGNYHCTCYKIWFTLRYVGGGGGGMALPLCMCFKTFDLSICSETTKIWYYHVSCKKNIYLSIFWDKYTHYKCDLPNYMVVKTTKTWYYHCTLTFLYMWRKNIVLPMYMLKKYDILIYDIWYIYYYMLGENHGISTVHVKPDLPKNNNINKNMLLPLYMYCLCTKKL